MTKFETLSLGTYSITIGKYYGEQARPMDIINDKGENLLLSLY